MEGFRPVRDLNEDFDLADGAKLLVASTVDVGWTRRPCRARLIAPDARSGDSRR
ncbi:hypothetical protein [Amycolatopsis circi]|uniref:hypothetical protein n=1 Tax=Amycolatopsis circi TaxID=871959 RepID=UPI0013BEA9A9|nr:hypothetical protein [Amycolatopsis circi]